MGNLNVNILGIDFETPFLLASAPPTAQIESIDKAFELGWSGAVLKTIKPDNFELNDVSPRYAIMEENGSVIGFQNIELLSHNTIQYWIHGINFLKKKYPKKVIIASIMAPVIKKEWQNLVLQLNNTPIDAFELNFSCPHGMPEKNIGMAIGTNAEISSMITSWVHEVSLKPVFVKLTPNVTDITEISQAVEKSGADGFTAINTVSGFMGINLDTLEPKLCINGMSTYGGCSGKIIRPIGLKCVSQIRKTSSLPILATGGISTWEDAVQYIVLGADAVQICTEVMVNGYDIIKKITSGLTNYLELKGINSLSELKNIAINKITTHENLDKNYKLNPCINKEKCVTCGKCVKICSESEHQALYNSDNDIQLNKKECVGCSLCKYVCPRNAITMK